MNARLHEVDPAKLGILIYISRGGRLWPTRMDQQAPHFKLILENRIRNIAPGIIRCWVDPSRVAVLYDERLLASAVEVDGEINALAAQLPVLLELHGLPALASSLVFERDFGDSYESTAETV